MDREGQGTQLEQSGFKLQVPLFAELSVYRVQERPVTSGSQRVLLTHVHFEGCRFRTHLRIPARSDVLWSLKLTLGHHSIQLKAVIMRLIQEDGLFLYEANWKMTNADRYAYQVRLYEYLQSTLAASPHILALYKKITERQAFGQFRKYDISS